MSEEPEQIPLPGVVGKKPRRPRGRRVKRARPAPGPEDVVFVRVKVSGKLLKRIDGRAKLKGMSRGAWVVWVLKRVLDRVEGG